MCGSVKKIYFKIQRNGSTCMKINMNKNEFPSNFRQFCWLWWKLIVLLNLWISEAINRSIISLSLQDLIYFNSQQLTILFFFSFSGRVGSTPDKGVPDMTCIPDIDETGINNNLKVRYQRDEIYVSYFTIDFLIWRGISLFW